MTPSELHLLVRTHGVLAWGALVTLILAIALGRARRRLLTLAVTTTTVLGGGAFATGAMLHAPFQSKLRQRLFLASSTLGWLFERKEHVAFGAVAMLGCAACATWAESVSRGRDEGTARTLGNVRLIALVAAVAFEGFAIAVSLATSARVGF